jgi:hypothetical protein
MFNMYTPDRLCGLVVRVPGYTTEIIVLPVRYELNYYVAAVG